MRRETVFAAELAWPDYQAAVEKGELALHGAYFGVASGKLLVRNEATGAFEPVG